MLEKFFQELKWDEELRGGHNLESGPIVQRNKFLFSLFGLCFVLHEFIDPILDEWFHTHQARWGLRIILLGGYEEQIWPSFEHRVWRPGMLGIIPMTLCHRVLKTLKGRSYSLWVRPETKFSVIRVPVDSRFPTLEVSDAKGITLFNGNGWNFDPEEPWLWVEKFEPIGDEL